MEENKSNFNLYLMGGLIGALIGIIAAFLIEKSAEDNESGSHFSKEKLAKLGFGTVSALWTLIDPGKRR